MSLIRDPVIITAVGHQMMTAGGDITYTKATLYGQDISHLTKDQLESLTSIGNPLLTVPVGISDKSVDGEQTTIALEATFTNANLKADLPYKAVGFFAKKDNGEEKLVILGVANSGAYLAAASPDGVASDALDVKVAIAIGDATSVTAVVDPAGSVTPATLNGAINKATHDLTAKIDTKADKTDVTAQFATKADKTTVEQELAVKANSADVYTKKQVDDALSSRDTAIATKADKATVDSEISKIDFTPYAKTADVNAELATKADQAAVTRDLATKASNTDIQAANAVIATKADKTALDATNKTVATKANSDDVYTKTQVDKQIKSVTDLANSKVGADYSYSKAELDKKLLAVTTDTSGKVNATQVASMIADKADKTYVDNQIASIDFGKIKFRKQYVNSDGQTADKTWSATKNQDGTYTIDLWQDDWTASKLSGVLAQLPNKADTSTVNAQIADAKNTIKSSVDNLQSAINTKANASDVYTKNQIGDAFRNRDNSISTLINRVEQIDGETVIGNAVDVNTLEGTPNQVTVYKLLNASNTNTPSWNSDHRGVMIVLNYDGNAKTQIWIPVGSGAFNKDGSFGWRYWEGENPPDWNRLASVSYVDNLHNDLQNQINANDQGTIVTGYDWNTGTSTNESRSLQNTWIVDQTALRGAVNRMNDINSNANGRLSLGGGNMNLRSTINWNGGEINDKTGNLGGLNWAGGTDWAKIYGDQDGNDNLDLAIDLGDDGSNHVSFRKNGSETSAITSDGHFTGTVDWSNVSGRPDVATHADVNNAIDSIRYAPQERRSLGADDDANNIVDDGVYRISGSPIKNGNGKSWCFLRVKRWDYNTIFQELDCGSDGIFVRNISQTNKNYPGWQKIATSDDISNLQNIINQQNQTIQSLTSRLNNAENEINYIKANYVEGRTFPASQEAQANSWENENPQRIAFITK